MAKGDVGTGTIVGSGVMNILLVIGLCGLASCVVTRVHWWPVFRDSASYAVSVLILILVTKQFDVFFSSNEQKLFTLIFR